MPRKTLKEIAATDVQVARFLDRASASRQETKPTEEKRAPEGTKLHYHKNHLPKARNISKEAREAITACILG
jgi:hypothetical protein